jgi:hypothetical protein
MMNKTWIVLAAVAVVGCTAMPGGVDYDALAEGMVASAS